MSTDRLTVQMVVFFIGLCSLIIISGLIALAYTGRTIPEPLSTLGGATIGALGTLLARTATNERSSGPSDLRDESRLEESRRDESRPVAVEIKNSPSSPVPTAPVAAASSFETESVQGE